MLVSQKLLKCLTDDTEAALHDGMASMRVRRSCHIISILCNVGAGDETGFDRGVKRALREFQALDAPFLITLSMPLCVTLSCENVAGRGGV